VALASHQFTDVPTSSPHHDDISAIAGAGITSGCAPSLYCPADPVRRDQMGTFLRRGFGRVGASGTTADLTLTNTYQDLAVDTITAGGAPGGSGFVVVTGDFSMYGFVGSMDPNHRINFRLVQDGGGTSNENDATLYTNTATTGAPSASVAKTWVFSVSTGTTYTFRLQARIAFPASGVDTINAGNRHITLLYVPFGSSGTSSLSTQGDSTGSGPSGAADGS
jgi:hypothetical protein